MRHFNFALTVLLFFSSALLYSQWSSDVMLSVSSGPAHTSYNGAWSISASDMMVHTTWIGYHNGYHQSFYRRSTDGGLNWEPELVMTTNTWYNCDYPAVSSSDTNVYLIYMYNHNASNDLFYRHSTDRGQTWSARVNLTNNVQTYQSSVASIGTDVHVIIPELFGMNYMHSTTGILSEWSDIQLIQASGLSAWPSVAVSGTNISVVWPDSRDGNSEIYYKPSSNDGGTWQSDIRLTNNSASSLYPCVAVAGNSIHVVWNDNRDGTFQIYYKHSTDGGLSWSTDTRLTSSADTSYLPSIASTGANVHVVWEDHRDGNWEIYYKSSSNAGNSWSPDIRLTNDTAMSQFPSVAVSGTTVHVIWTDYRNGAANIFYKRNPTGNVLGINPVSGNIPASYSLYQNYPNPFNPSTIIKFDIPENVKRQTSNVKLIIYDAVGRETAVLVDEQLNPGTYEVSWNAANYPSGVYFYRLEAGDLRQTKKLVLVK